MKKYFYSNTAVTSTEDTHTSNFKHQTETQEEILATKTSTMSLKTEVHNTYFFISYERTK